MQGLKSAILAIFQRGPGWLCLVSTALENPSVDLKNYFWHGYEFLAMLQGKSRKGPFFWIQTGKITVCRVLCHVLRQFSIVLL